MGELLSVTAGLCFAVSTMMAQRGLRQASASTGVLVNILVNNLMFGLLLLIVIVRNTLPEFNPEGVLFAIAGGLTGTAIGRNLSYLAVRRIGAARAVLLSLTQTLFAFILGLIFLGEALSMASVFGMVLVVFGVYWLSKEQLKQQDEAAATIEGAALFRSRAALGILLAITAGLAYTGADLMRKLSLKQMPSAVVASALGAFAALLLQLLIFSFRNGWHEASKLDKKALMNFSLSGVANGLAVLALNTALGFTPIVIVNALYNTRVWFTIALGPVLLGSEGKITKPLLGSALLILGGTLIIIIR